MGERHWRVGHQFTTDWTNQKWTVGTVMLDNGASTEKTYPDYKVHGANMPPWRHQDAGGPHVGHINLAIWVVFSALRKYQSFVLPFVNCLKPTITCWRMISALMPTYFISYPDDTFQQHDLILIPAWISTQMTWKCVMKLTIHSVAPLKFRNW